MIEFKLFRRSTNVVSFQCVRAGKPLWGTLIALLYKGVPILGVIDQPILQERWVGAVGQKTTLNGKLSSGLHHELTLIAYHQREKHRQTA